MPTTRSPMLTLDDDSLILAAPASYVGVSVRNLRGYVDGPPGEALPCYRMGGKIAVKRPECDGGVQQFRSSRPPSMMSLLAARADLERAEMRLQARATPTDRASCGGRGPHRVGYSNRRRGGVGYAIAR